MKKLTIAVLFLLSACAKDKTAEEHQREKHQRNLAQIEAAAGVYTGIVNSEQTGEVLGAMKLNLWTDTKPKESPNGDPAIGSPVLRGEVDFLDDRTYSFSIKNSYYDPSTGYFSSEVEIMRGGQGGPPSPGEGGGDGSGGMGGGKAEIVKVSGYIQGSSFNGAVFALDHPGYGGRFELVRDRGEGLEEQLKRARPGKSSRGERLATFVGETEFRVSKNVRPVHIVVDNPKTGRDEDFLDIVNPVKKVELGLNYGKSISFLFPDTTYDTRQGYIVASKKVLVEGLQQNMTIECRETDGQLSCGHSSSSLGHAGTSHLERRDLADDNPSDPKDDQSIAKTFFGKGVFLGKLKTIELRAVYPARTRRESLNEEFFPSNERLLRVTVAFTKDVTMPFQAVKWDVLNGLLDGINDGNASGPFTAYLQCHDFYFDFDQDKPFKCSYYTTRSPLIEIDFQPPFKK